MGYQGFVGRSETRMDFVHAQALRGLAATLGSAVPAQAVLPPLWHWLLFQDWPPLSALAADGTRLSGFLAEQPDGPRHWAGGRLRFSGPLRQGEPVIRTSTVLDMQDLPGQPGQAGLMVLRHHISGASGLAVVEEQDFLTTGRDLHARRPAEPAEHAPAGHWSRKLTPDAVLLHRFSALTGNDARIHYDMEYAMRVACAPGLVVQTALLVILLADLMAREMPGREVRRLMFRAPRPVFADRPLVLQAWPAGGEVHMRVLDETGTEAVTAEAELAASP